MSKKEKRLIILLILIVVISIAIMMIYKNKNKENVAQETEQEVEEVPVQVTGKAVEEKTTNEYKISNIKMTAKSSETEVMLTIKNISNKSTKERDVYIKYLDNQNQEIGKTRIHLPKMEKEKEITMSTIMTKDLKNAADYIIEY